MLLFIGCIQSCHEDEASYEINEPITTSYNSTILSYLANLKSEAGKENGTKIEALKEAINLNTIHIYELKSTEKLLIADISALKGFESYNATKVIFFVLNNSVIRSNLVTINNKEPFKDVNQIVVSIFNMKKNKDNYSGKIAFYNLFQSILLSNELENGKLIVNGVALKEPKRSSTGKTNGCIAWFWVTTYASGKQTAEYMYTTCNCEEQTARTNCGGGGGGGGSSNNNNSGQPNYPENPKDKALLSYVDTDGEIVTKQYNMEIGKWELVSISLPAVVINNNPTKYGFLIFAWPSDGQKILNNLILYTYDAASGNWNGEPETPEKIAKAIEEQIDDSKLDPCTKAIMEKLKNLTNSDIASIFEKFGVPVNGTYNIEIVLGKPKDNAKASTTSFEQNNYKITILDTYIYGTDNNGKPPTDLSIAAVIIHELVHANFLALFDDYHNNGDICAYDNFTCLYENYVSKNYQGTIDAQHAQMFDNYIDKMASMLAEFKPGQSYEFYRNLAMSTMTGLQYFEDRYPKGSAERSRIIQSRLAEDNNEARGDILPKGTPCSK
ncbi:hypothetical protein [Flavobacterium sp.]|uniref:hypothetical protein n=1 Tax=Flavobacterium sp. TaxID=239 RepID=UPI0026043E97|nr:hypothetical protein [Flavobacterium sp.]